MDLFYCLALILGFCGCLAAFRFGLDAAFDQARSASAALRRPAAFVLAACVFLLCGGMLHWITEGSPLPLSAAFVALFQFVFADRRSEAEVGLTRSERGASSRLRDPRYPCAACSAPVPEGLDQCPCCAERVPWEARAAEVLPIPTVVSSADASSLPVPAIVEEPLSKRGIPEFEAVEPQASTQRTPARRVR